MTESQKSKEKHKNNINVYFTKSLFHKSGYLDQFSKEFVDSWALTQACCEALHHCIPVEIKQTNKNK